MCKKWSYLCFSVVLLLPGIAAHLAAGTDVEKNGYILDIGYSPEKLLSNRSTQFVLNIVNATTQQPSNVSQVWVRIDSDTGIAFSGTFAVQQGSTSFLYQFPASGTHNITLQYRNGDAPVITHSVLLSVQGQHTDISSPDRPWVISIGAAIVLIGSAVVITKKVTQHA